MRAVVQIGSGSADVLEVREIDRPSVGRDRVLVRVHAASVNAADWHFVHTLPRPIGMLLHRGGTSVRGMDMAGRVEAVGSEVTLCRPGDEVFGTAAGAFAEFAATSEGRLAPKPRTLTFEQAAAMPVAGITALQGLRDTARVQPGQSVLVNGAGGGVGTFTVQIAKALGARVTAVTSTGNVDLARSLGADEVVDYTREDFTGRGQRHDVIFDSGANRSFADLRRALSPRGIVVLAGAATSMGAIVSRLLAARLLSRSGGQRFAPMLARIRREDLVVLTELVEAGKVRPVMDREYALEQAREAVAYVGTRQARGKVVLRVG